MADDDTVNNEFRGAWQKRAESKMTIEFVLQNIHTSFETGTMQVSRVK